MYAMHSISGINVYPLYNSMCILIYHIYIYRYILCIHIHISPAIAHQTFDMSLLYTYYIAYSARYKLICIYIYVYT